MHGAKEGKVKAADMEEGVARAVNVDHMVEATVGKAVVRVNMNMTPPVDFSMVLTAMTTHPTHCFTSNEVSNMDKEGHDHMLAKCNNDKKNTRQITCVGADAGGDFCF